MTAGQWSIITVPTTAGNVSEDVHLRDGVINLALAQEMHCSVARPVTGGDGCVESFIQQQTDHG